MFMDYTPLTVTIIGYIPCTVQYILLDYIYVSCITVVPLNPLLLHCPLPLPSPHGNH